MSQEAVNHVISLPDDLNLTKQLEFQLDVGEEDYLNLNSNEDNLNKRISLNNNDTVTNSPLELISKPNQLNNKKLDSDSDSGLCSATEELGSQQNDSSKIDKFNQELLSKAHEINEKNLLKLKFDETSTNTLPVSSQKHTKSYRSLSIIGKRASNRMLKMNFHRTSIGSIQQHSQDDSKDANDFSEFSKSIRFDMPSLTEINEVSNNTLTSLNSNDTFNDTNSQTENIAINNSNALSVPASASEMNANKSSSANILTSLEYLMNNSNKFNTTVAIANIAAAASAAENNLITSDTETVLQNFFMDLVIPNVDQTSNNNLNNNIANDNELSLIYQQHLMDTTANYLSSNSNPNGDLNSTSGLPESSSTFNLATLNANKQTNDQIMRTCMGYLDYINKKHNKERRTQIIRNKISGFVLLTLVFLMVFGLAMIMVFCLTNALAKILLTHSSTRAPLKQLIVNNENKTVLLSDGSISNYSKNRLKIEDTNLMMSNIKLEPLVKQEIRGFITNLLEILIKSGLNLTQQNLTIIEASLFNMTAFTLSKYLEDDSNAPSEIRYYRFIDEIN